MDILTPVGRLVQGDLFTGRDKDMEGRPLTDSAGNPRKNYFVGVAIPKNDPGITPLLQQMQQEAMRCWPNGEAQNPANFSFKFLDGDQPPHNTKEGFANCYVLKFSSSFAPKVMNRGGSSVITDTNAVKRGYFVRIFGNYKSNESRQKPGMYLNLSMAEFVGYGEEIVSGPNGDVFANQAADNQFVQGMSDTPLAPQTTNVAMQPAPVQQQGQPAPVQQQGQPAPVQQQGQPAPVQQQGQPAPVQQQGQPAPVQQQGQPDFGFLNVPQQ